ncbi:hypothetical protein Tco_1011410 [Tanacetum coccineum]
MPHQRHVEATSLTRGCQVSKWVQLADVAADVACGSHCHVAFLSDRLHVGSVRGLDPETVRNDFQQIKKHKRSVKLMLLEQVSGTPKDFDFEEMTSAIERVKLMLEEYNKAQETVCYLGDCVVIIFERKEIIIRNLQSSNDKVAADESLKAYQLASTTAEADLSPTHPFVWVWL